MQVVSFVAVMSAVVRSSGPERPLCPLLACQLLVHFLFPVPVPVGERVRLMGVDIELRSWSAPRLPLQCLCSGGLQSHSRQAALGRPRRFWTSTSQWTTVPCWADLQRGDRPGLPFFESRPRSNSAPVLSGALPDLRHGNGPSCWRSCKGLMDRAIYGAPM